MSIAYDIAKRLAMDAVTLAQMKAREQMNISEKTLGCLIPIANEDGSFGIQIDPQAYYLYFQNTGIRAFTMYSLDGKVIPIRTPFGIIFRKATNIGKPGKINKRDPKTGQILPGNTGVKWRHPGLAPKNFIEFGLQESMRQNYPKYSKLLINSLIQESVKEKAYKDGIKNV